MKRVLMIARAFLVALTLSAAPHLLQAQSADSYRGTVVNDDLTGQPADLELFIFSRSDSNVIGWMKVGQPLSGSGMTVVVRRDMDSLYFVTVTPERDTLVWASAQRTGTLEGRYWIKGSRFGGQGGRWRLSPQPRVSQAALIVFAICAGAATVLGIAALSAVVWKRWWAWRLRAAALASDDERRKLNDIAGWLTWVVLTQGFLVLYLVGTIGTAADGLGGTWMLGTGIAGMRPTLFLEAAGHFSQLFGIVLGLVLLVRRSPLAPPYWVALLAVTAAYAFIDLSAGSSLTQTLTNAFGPDASEMTRGIREAETQNQRLISSALIWSLYWIRSRRVLVVFGPSASRRDEQAPDVTPPANVTVIASSSAVSTAS